MKSKICVKSQKRGMPLIFIENPKHQAHAKCKACGEDIYFYKSKRGKWCVMELVGCGNTGCWPLQFHKCKKN